jgi:hypothetical protein
MIMPDKILSASQGLFAFIAGTSGFVASITASLPELDAIGKWPLTVVLGAVCVICVYFMYRQSRDNAERTAFANENYCKTLVTMAEGERLATEKLMSSNTVAARELAESHAKALKDATENHSKEIKTLIDEIITNRPKG